MFSKYTPLSIYKIRRYLRPNFSNHPLNIIFIIFVFFLSFFFSSLALAMSPQERDWYENSTENDFRGNSRVDTRNQAANVLSKFTLCSSVSSGSLCVNGYIPNDNATHYAARISIKLNETSTTHRIIRFYHSRPHLPQFPDFDAITNCPADGTVAGTGLLDPSMSTVGQYKGCRIVVRDADLNCTPDMYCQVVAIYEHDGELATNEPPIEPNEDSIVTPLLGTHVDPNSTDSVTTSDTEVLPDGTVFKTETTVTTELRGKGTDRQETETTTVVQMSNGITRITTETVTEITNPDGSKTITTETHTAYTSHPITTHVIDKSTTPPTHTESSTQPKQAESTTTTTKTVDASGKVTGTSTSTTSSGGSVGSGHSGSVPGSGSGEGEGDEEGCENCDAPGYEEGGSWWESNYPEGLGGIFEMHKDALLNAAMIGTITDTSGIASSGAFPLFTFPAWTIGPMSIPAKQLELDPRVAPFMRVAFLFVAAVVCRRLIFGG